MVAHELLFGVLFGEQKFAETAKLITSDVLHGRHCYTATLLHWTMAMGHVCVWGGGGEGRGNESYS